MFKRPCGVASSVLVIGILSLHGYWNILAQEGSRPSGTNPLPRRRCLLLDYCTADAVPWPQYNVGADSLVAIAKDGGVRSFQDLT